MDDLMSQPQKLEEELWPEDYEAPTVEPLGTIWDRTGGTVGAGGDVNLLATA